MGRHSKRIHSNSTSSQESDEERVSRRKKYKRKLEKKQSRIQVLEGLVQELRGTQNDQNNQPIPVPSESSYTPLIERTNSPVTTVRYVGRNDVLPEFDPQTSSVSIEHWIRNAESIANMYGWDKRTLICNCTSKLRGYAKGWYERQVSYDVSWDEWKERLIKAFPFTRNKLSQIRDLVNRVKPSTEDPIKFYYEKLGIGMSCGMTDEVIAEAIIGTLGDKLLEIGAVSAGCHDPTSLLKYLASIKTSISIIKPQPTTTQIQKKEGSAEIKCYSCGKNGHKARMCTKTNKNKKCRFCDRIGHIEAECYKKKNQNKHCEFCDVKGHATEECRKKITRAVKKVHTVCTDSSDQKYYKSVKINGVHANAFIDFGSSCNTMTEAYSKKLTLTITSDDAFVIKGYGDALTLPTGITRALLTVDGVEKVTDFYVVPDNIQKFDVLIGQPFTEAPNVIVLKTSTQLGIYESEMDIELPELCTEFNKICLYPQSEITISPGVNTILTRTEPVVTGVLALKHGEHRKSRCEKDILGEELESIDGSAIVKVINMTSEDIKIKSDDCIARVNLVQTQSDCSGPKIGKSLTERQQNDLNLLLEKYKHCFSGDGMELGNCNIEMSIKLMEDKVVNYRPYRMSYHEREIVRTRVAELMAAGIVEKSKSPFASPVLLVKKKDGGYRMCIDYRALNKITEKERYPIPVIQDLLDRLVDKTVFCCLDLANGYHQIKIAKDSRAYTAFVTPDGHFQYRMMSFGLCNAPAVFQRAMNEILAPVLHNCAEVYIDDVILWGENIQSCLENLEKVLKLIADAGVKLKMNKCTFLTDTVEYLGHEISRGTIRPSSHKLAAVKEFKIPRNVHELRQFLGLASYFRKFIKGFAIIARPLTRLTKKSVEWKWNEEQGNAVASLKTLLTSDPVLAIYNPNLEIQVHTDASKVGLGGVLLQRQTDGVYKVVAYASRQTSATEEKYHSFELEALAVVFSIQKFKVYVTGTKFTVVTDCSALRLAWSKRDLSPRITRWWLDLQEYDFEVDHRPGTSMQHVDALSRNPLGVKHIEEKDLIDSLQEGDEEIQALIVNLKLELKANKHKKDGLSKDYKIVNDRLHRVVGNEIRPVLPKGAKWHILQIYHDKNGHLGGGKCLEAIRAKYWFPKMRRYVEKYTKSCIGCQFTKKPTGKQPGLLHPIQRVATPFHTLHVDHLGPFCKSSGKTYIVAVIDGFTKFVWLDAVAAPNAKGVLSTLNKLTQVFGYPVRIISDKGTAFTGHEFREYCNRFGIKHVQNAVATPRANGQVERLNRTVLASLTACMGEQQKGWDAYLAKVQLGINSSVSQGTGKTPMELLCGLRPRLAGEVQGPENSKIEILKLRQEAAHRIEESALRMKIRFDKSRRITKPMALGTLVMVERKILRPGLASGKLVPRYAGPYRITAVLPNDRYEVTSAIKGKRGYKNIIARDKMKKWYSREVTSSDEE